MCCLCLYHPPSRRHITTIVKNGAKINPKHPTLGLASYLENNHGVKRFFFFFSCFKYAVDDRLSIDATFVVIRNTLGSLPPPLYSGPFVVHISVEMVPIFRDSGICWGPPVIDQYWLLGNVLSKLIFSFSRYLVGSKPKGSLSQ